MKKRTLAACAMAMTMLAAAGCSGSQTGGESSAAASTSAIAAESTTEKAAESTAANTAAAAGESTAGAAAASSSAGTEAFTEGTTAASAKESESASSEAKIVKPLPSGIDLNHLDDCTVAVSFDEGDAFVDDTGVMQLRVSVYVYDTYDIADIHMLQVGDQISICQKNVKVTSLDRTESGGVIINGGPEEGGYQLFSADGTGFYAAGENDTKEYYALGEATIPVSEDFEFEDSSSPDQGTRTYYPGDFLTDEAGINYFFIPNNTTIRIQDGSVIRMDRVYIP